MTAEQTKTETWQVTVTDLWRESEGGWSENGCWHNRTTITVPAGLSDTALRRKLKSAAGIQGFRHDEWCSADFCWRSGCIGAYADLVD